MAEAILIEVLPDGAPADQEELSRSLRSELQDVGVDAEWPITPTRAGSKSPDAIVYAILALPLLSDPETVRAVVNCLFGWLPRQRSCTIRLRHGEKELEVTDLSGADARRLAEELLSD